MTTTLLRNIAYSIKHERMLQADSGATIVLPFPEAALFPNRSNGKHWATRQAAKKQARSYAFTMSCHLALDEARTDRAVTIIVAPPDKRRRDVDGILAALKPSLDGIAQALGIDDMYFNPIEIRRIDPVPGGCVTVIIHEPKGQ
jgi:crossover junction endodeoxyribonuclease RusA